MLNVEPPSVSQVLRANKLILLEKSEKSVDKEFVIVSVFGSSNGGPTGPSSHGSTHFKQPFQLAIDAFGLVHFDTPIPQKWKSAVDNEKDQVTLDGATEISPTNPSVGQGQVTSEEEITTNGHSQDKVQDDDGYSGKICSIDGFYNEEESVLFLHLEGAHDPHFVLNACQDLQSNLNDPDFIPKWVSLKSKYCQSLLLLFTLSHIMMLSSPDSYFDTTYIHLFRAIDAVRLLVRPFMSQLLSELEGLPRHWVDQGRLCSPKLLFFFEVDSVIPPRKLVKIFRCPDPESEKSILFEKQQVEDDIFQIFRKCRIITNNSAHSLFSVSRSHEFVYFHDKSLLEIESVQNHQIFSQTILQFCNAFTEIKDGDGGTSDVTSTAHPILPPPSRHVFFTPKEIQIGRSVPSDFREFLLTHIRAVREYEEQKRNNEQKNYLVRPTWKEWTVAYSTLFNYLVLGRHEESKAIEATSHLEKYCNLDAEYLENQCGNMFTKIYGTYQKNIPEFYSEEEHRSRLKLAANAFLTISRSSGIVPWLDKLALKCERYWKSGHQQCETRSLHEHPCINQLHRVPPGDHLEVVPFPDMDPSLPELHHNAGNRLSSYCNCGKRSMNRDEPFTIREANYDFYKRAGRDCCEKLEAWEFPIFVPAIDGEKELSLKEMLDILRNKSMGEDDSNLNPQEDFEILENASQAVETQLRQENQMDDDEEEQEQSDEVTNSNHSNEGDEKKCDSEKVGDEDFQFDHDLESNLLDLYTETEIEALSQDILPEEMPNFEAPTEIETEESTTNDQVEQADLTEENQLTRHRSSLAVQSSTVEYLPGMFHSKSPHGLLPIFPSWSLVCLGLSRIYSHNTGITHQPGFLAGSNFLLPWDVKVKSNDGGGGGISNSKPFPRLFRGGRPPIRRIQRDEFNVKIFIGLEYECKRGHRFFVENPGKVLFHLNTTETLNKKEAANKVATTDMPLYTRCPCNSRDGRESIAQLLRLHVVTPKAPVNVTLNPRVQPGPHPCPIFTPGHHDPIKLTPSAYWVLRLPYAYVGDDRVFVPPQDLTSYNGRLMRNLCGVVPMSPTDTKIWKSQNATT